MKNILLITKSKHLTNHVGRLLEKNLPGQYHLFISGIFNTAEVLVKHYDPSTIIVDASTTDVNIFTLIHNHPVSEDLKFILHPSIESLALKSIRNGVTALIDLYQDEQMLVKILRKQKQNKSISNNTLKQLHTKTNIMNRIRLTFMSFALITGMLIACSCNSSQKKVPQNDSTQQSKVESTENQTQEEQQSDEETPQRPNGYSEERGYYYTDTDCDKNYSKMDKNEGTAEALRYMSPDCAGNVEYSEAVAMTLGITMRQKAAECIDFIGKELIDKGKNEQANYIISRINGMFIDSEEDYEELKRNLARAKDTELKRRIEKIILDEFGKIFDQQPKEDKLANIDVSQYAFKDEGIEILSGVLKSAVLTKENNQEIAYMTIKEKSFGNVRIVISPNIKTLPEISGRDGMAFIKNQIGKTVWIQTQKMKGPDGQMIKVATNMVINQKERFASFVVNDEKLVYDFIEKLVNIVRSGNKHLMADMIYPQDIKHNEKTYQITNRQEALDAVDVVMNGKVKSAIVNQLFTDLFANQYGIMLGNGEVWINYNMEKKKMEIFSINPF